MDGVGQSNRGPTRTPRRVAAILGIAVLTFAGVALSATPGDAAPTTQPFAVGTSTFQVPAGVCSISVTAFGAQGGSISGVGGLGGEATATIAVTPGEVLQVRVGGQGLSGGGGGPNGGGAGGGGGPGGGVGGAGGGGACGAARLPMPIA